MSTDHSPRIALIGFKKDEHVARIGHRLAERNIDAIGVDLSTFPERCTLTVSSDKLLVNDVDLLSFDAFVLRQVGYMWPMPASQPSALDWGRSYEDFAAWMSSERESTSLKYSLVSILSDLRPVVNPVGCFLFHQMKPLMYTTLADAGVPVPPWVAGNEPEALRDMALTHGDDPAAVVKPLAGGAEVVAASAEPSGLAHMPLLYQRCVNGESMRAYVVGERVVAAGIIKKGEALDWRRDSKGATACDLDQTLAGHAVAATKALGMHFAALDIERDERGDWFLDVNPTPMFTRFEDQTGQDITGPLIDHLLKLASERSS